MRSGLVFILVFSAFSAFGQKHVVHNENLNDDLFAPIIRDWKVKSTLSESQLTDVEAIAALIKEELEYGENIELEHTYTRHSQALSHYHFDIIVNDLKVFGGEIHTAIDKNGNLKVIQHPALPFNNIDASSTYTMDPEQVRLALNAELILHAEPVLILANGMLTGGLRVELAGPEQLHREVICQGTEIIYNNDKLKHFSAAGPNDTTVDVKVFDPDPLTTSQQSYGGSYSDNEDKNSGQLNSERQTRSTTFTYENGLFKPQNDYVKITEFSAPITSIATSTNSNFSFTRDKSQFEDVNVVFHITQQAHHLESIGYPNVPSYQIEVDAHALNGADQSYFSTSTFPYRLYFGEGGVDDAEDADVILHEYGHAIIYEVAPTGSKDSERKCMEEAICDYFAVSYSRTVSSFNYDEVFNWDGHNEFWPGRSVNASGKTYAQATFLNGNYYAHTDLFSGILLDIYDRLGRTTTDQLVIESSYFLTSSTKMYDFAEFMYRSDSLLNGGANIRAISEAFFLRGVVGRIISTDEVALSEDAFEILNTYGFAIGQSVMVEYHEGLQSYELYDLKGQLVAKQLIEGKERIEISSGDLQPGVYILKVKASDGNTATVKLSRFTH